MTYKTLEIKIHSNHLELILNRPDKHNAINFEMINEINSFCKDINTNEFRYLIIRGNGKSFCSGADLEWMKEVAKYSLDENINESKKLAEMFYNLYMIEIPIITITHGFIFGGANGILAISDFVLAEKSSVFSFSEVKLGLIPAVISPYVLSRTDSTKVKQLFITGDRFNTKIAKNIGLVDKTFITNYDKKLDRITKSILSSAPEAVKQIKKLTREIENQRINDDLIISTVDAIAKRRISNEGQKGMNAFLNREKIEW